MQEIIDLVIRFRKGYPHWGYTRIRDYIVRLGYRIGETTVRNILLEHGFDPEPDLTRKTTWRKLFSSHCDVLAARDFFSVELLVTGRLVRCMLLFAIELSTRKVESLGVWAGCGDRIIAKPRDTTEVCTRCDGDSMCRRQYPVPQTPDCD